MNKSLATFLQCIGMLSQVGNFQGSSLEALIVLEMNLNLAGTFENVPHAPVHSWTGQRESLTVRTGESSILLRETPFSILTTPTWIGCEAYGKQYRVEKEGISLTLIG